MLGISNKSSLKWVRHDLFDDYIGSSDGLVLSEIKTLYETMLTTYYDAI